MSKSIILWKKTYSKITVVIDRVTEFMILCNQFIYLCFLSFFILLFIEVETNEFIVTFLLIVTIVMLWLQYVTIVMEL